MPAPISVGSRSQLSSGWVALLAAALTSLAACSGTGSEPFAHSDAIDSIAAAALEEGPILGLSIGVAHNGHVVFEAGYGVTNIDATSPATGHTIYNIASTAKILAAAAVVKLAESGQLDLDDRLESLLPDVPNRESVGKITVRQLLNMTSGLNDYVGADVKRLETSDEPLDPSFVLDHVQQNPLDFEPGTNWIYSNTGFYLAGLIVERISGRAWGEYVVTELVVPLGLESTQLCDDVVAVRATGYQVADGVYVPHALDAERGVRGDGGLCSTVRDLAKLPAALEGGRVISASGLAAMIAPTQLTSGPYVDYGLGVATGVFGTHRLWGHLGGSGSLVSTLAHYPDAGFTIAVLMNTRGAELDALVVEGRVAALVLNTEPRLLDNHVDADAAEKLVGTYVGGRSASRVEVRYEDGHVTRHRLGDSNSRLTLLSQGGRTFGRADWPYDRLVFQPDTGHAQSYSVYYNGVFDGFFSLVQD